MLKGLNHFFIKGIVLMAIQSVILPSYAVALQSSRKTETLIRSYDLNSRIELGVQHYQTALSDESAQSYLGFGSQYLHSVSDFVNFELSPFIYVRSGYVQSDLYEPSNSNGIITVEHAAMEFHNGIREYFGQMGIIQASRYTSPLLLSRVGSTGVLAGTVYSLSAENSSIEFTQQLNVPNSFQQNYTFDQRAQLPKLLISNARLNYQFQNWGFRSSFAYFQAQVLSESLAENSNTKGNSIIFSSDARRTRFVFNYNVMETHLESYFFYQKSNSVGLAVTHIQNILAPAGLNQGYLIESKLDFELFKNRIRFSYQFFNIEPDATVSGLNSPLFETNRVGQRVTMSLSPSKFNTFTLRVAERDVVYTHPFQQHEFLTSFEWETRYEIL
jgi:hypothetical protein